jgi:REP element-mobilizing transposase RayT
MLCQSFTYYHIISRVNHGEYLLDDGEKERLVGFFRDAEVLGCGQIVTYSILDNHWHCLLSIDHNAKVPEELVVKRVRARYGDFRADEFAQEVSTVRELNGEDAAQAVLNRYRRRMNNLAEFAKDALQRFTMSYNRRQGCGGGFWKDRYNSSIVEGESAHDTKALATIAAYIDLNAVRAGIVSDPGAYRFCGYGAAMGGDKHALASLNPVLDMVTQGAGAELSAYRAYIFRQGFDHAVSGSRSKAFRKLAHKVLKKGNYSATRLLNRE